MTAKTLGKFGHHPDPAIDFEIEVQALQGADADHRAGLAGRMTKADFDRRMEVAMAFRVGGDAGAIAAKDMLRRLAGIQPVAAGCR